LVSLLYEEYLFQIHRSIRFQYKGVQFLFRKFLNTRKYNSNSIRNHEVHLQCSCASDRKNRFHNTHNYGLQLLIEVCSFLNIHMYSYRKIHNLLVHQLYNYPNDHKSKFPKLHNQLKVQD